MRALITPHITEKSHAGIPQDAALSATYTFRVRPEVDAPMVRALVSELFKVTVTNVRMINLPSKRRVFRGKPGETQPIHKALVTLKAGERIVAFEPATEEAKEGKE